MPRKNLVATMFVMAAVGMPALVWSNQAAAASKDVAKVAEVGMSDSVRHVSVVADNKSIVATRRTIEPAFWNCNSLPALAIAVHHAADLRANQGTVSA